jgi:class 3 adenylate cyclase
MELSNWLIALATLLASGATLAAGRVGRQEPAPAEHDGRGRGAPADPWPRDSGPAGGPALPGGTVTFLFTDVEGSTGLLEAWPAWYREALSRHHALLRDAVGAHGGTVFETVGDAAYAVFASPAAAAAAALGAQRALQQEPWGRAGELRVRMGLHTGDAEVRGGRYFGATLSRCARLMALASGRQVVLSASTATQVRDALPEGAGLRDLGLHPLKDLRRAERVYQLVHPALADAFPPLREPAPGHPAAGAVSAVVRGHRERCRNGRRRPVPTGMTEARPHDQRVLAAPGLRRGAGPS